jgi:hypothetical protein
LTAGATASLVRSRAAATGPEPLPLVAARPRLRAFAFARDAPFDVRFDALREAPFVFDAAALPFRLVPARALEPLDFFAVVRFAAVRALDDGPLPFLAARV